MADKKDTESPDFILLDERADTTKGRLEGRKPVGRLLGYLQKYLNTVHPPPYNCCGSSESWEPGRNRWCSREPEPPRKGFGMGFLLFVVCDFKRGRIDGVCKTEGRKPRVVSHPTPTVKRALSMWASTVTENKAA